MNAGTAYVLFVEMTLSLWVALYLLARGYGSASTRRVVVVLLALSAAALVSFYNLFHPLAAVGAWWSLFLTMALVMWYELVFQLMPAGVQRRRRWAHTLVWGLGLLKMALLLIFQANFPGEAGTSAWIVAGRATPLSIGDAAYILFAAGSLLLNLRISVRAGTWPNYHSPWLACALGAAGMAYGAAALLAPVPIARWPMDVLLTAAVAVLGYSTAYHEALILRHAPLLEFPVTGLTIAALTGVYLLVGRSVGIRADELGALGLLAVFTHSAYDVVREIISGWLYRRESAFRHRMRELVHTLEDDEGLNARLQAGLDNLCRALDAGGGFIALAEPADPGPEATAFVVRASRNSLPYGEVIPREAAAVSEIARPSGRLAHTHDWLVPVVAHQTQLAVIGLRRRRNGTAYSDNDLDWLDDASDWAGRLLELQAQQDRARAHVQEIAANASARAALVREDTDQLLDAIARGPEPAFVKQVEEALRRLADYGALGECELAAALPLNGATHLERGRAVRAALIQAVEALRPAAPRPAGILPREWHAYAILHDAYIEDVPNREIMARLYISEGTFNRQRRKALQAVARALRDAQAAAISV